MHEAIFSKLCDIFSIEKIKTDLLQYLNMNENSECDIISVGEFDLQQKRHKYSSIESVTLLSIKAQIKYLGVNYYPFQVECIIGKYEKDSDVKSLVTIEKFVAQMFYDSHYNIVTVDFIHW